MTDPKHAAERLLEANEDQKVTLTKKRLSKLTTRQTVPPTRVRTAMTSDADEDWQVKKIKDRDRFLSNNNYNLFNLTDTRSRRPRTFCLMTCSLLLYMLH